METTVKQIMRKKFTSLKKTDRLSKAIGIFLSNPDMVFPVVDNKGIVIGEVNQHDLLKLAVPTDFVSEEHILGPGGIKAVMEHRGKVVGDIMKSRKVNIVIKPGMKAVEAAKIMLDTGNRTLQVMDDDKKSVGYVSELDILRYIKKRLERKSK